jgi:hypothetical protein
MEVITRDVYIPSWVGERSVSSSRHETIELMKALMLLAGQNVKLVEMETVGETDNEFRDRMSTTAKFLEDAANKRYPEPSSYEDVEIYTGSEHTAIAILNARIAIKTWRLYHRLLFMRLLDDKQTEMEVDMKKEVG